MTTLEIIHNTLHAIFVPAAVWFWRERNILRDVLENKLERRNTMASIVDKFEEVSAAVGAVEALVPLIEKFIDDAKAAAPELEADGLAIELKLKAIFKSL